jgi:tetratricopeptide (TPR) repeat protein
MAEPVSRRDRFVWGALLVGACFAAYANGLTGTFTYDDKAIIRDNARIREPSRVAELFTTPYFGGPRGTGSNFRPVLLLSYAAQWWVHGKNALAIHVVNLMFHAAATIALGLLFLRIGVPPPASALAALFFALAPVHVEAVTSLVGRGETQTALFILLFLHVGLSFAAERRRRLVRVLAAALFFALAIFTKESAVVAPALLFLFLAFVEPGSFPRKLGAAFVKGWPIYAASSAILGGYVALRSWVLGGPFHAATTGIFEVENPLAPLPGGARAIHAALVLLHYIGRIVFPLHLSADESAWSIPVSAAHFSAPAVAAAALLCALLVLALARFPSGSHVAFGVLFFAVSFLVTANVLFPIGTIFGERIAYLPSAGILLAGAAVLADGAPSLAKLSRGRRLAAVAVALLFSARTVTRNAAWWSDLAIFANSVNVAPGSAKTHYNEGYILLEIGDLRGARSQYARAVAIYDGYWDAWAGKGRAEKELGRFDEAEASYRKSLLVNPIYENGFFGLGLVQEAERRLDAAAETYRRGLARIPDSLPLAYRLALLLSRSKSPGAGEAWRRALEIGPRSSAVHADRAAWLFDTGDLREAAREARRALRIDPNSATALRVLARRDEASGWRLGAALALEKACFVSRSAEDFRELADLAARCDGYRARFARVRPILEKRIPAASRRTGPAG